MKKVLLLVLVALTCLFFVGLNTVSAAEETASLSFANKEQRTSFSSSEQVWEQNGVTFVNKKASSTNAVADYANPVRLYQNSSIEVSVEGNITSIVFDCNSNSYATALKNSIGSTASESNDKVTVTLSGSEKSFTVAKLTAQVRLDSLTVNYVVSGGNEGEDPGTSVEPKPVEAATLKSLFTKYHNYGLYTRNTNIYIDKEAIKLDFGLHFHNPGKDGDNVILNRTTKFVDDYLYFVETGTGFGTSDTGALTSFKWNGSYPNSSSDTNAIEEKFVTLFDFISLTNDWYINEENKYFNETAAVLKAAEAFTAPGWQSPTAAYTEYSQVVVYEKDGKLHVELFVWATNEGITTNAAVGNHILFSEAIITPETNVSIEKALEIGASKEHNTYTDLQYTIEGTITEVKDTQWGNMYVTDGEGNTIYVYGLYQEGKRYDVMSYKPVVGDSVVLTGKLGTYNANPQIKSAELVEVTDKHTCVFGEATCTTPATCTLGCGTEKDDVLAEHVDAGKDHVCDVCGTGVGEHEDISGDNLCDYCGEEISNGGSQPSEPINNKYTFSNYTAGTQYAANEKHVLDDNVTITTTKCHFTSELRIYSSSTYNGYAIIYANGKTFTSIGFNAGNKADTLNVYGSTDGSTWTLIKGVSVTSTYTDYTVNIDETSGYKYIKLDVSGTNQVRLKTLTVAAQ